MRLRTDADAPRGEEFRAGGGDSRVSLPGGEDGLRRRRVPRCVTKTAKVDGHSHVRNARICTEGPVFDAEEVEIG